MRYRSFPLEKVAAEPSGSHTGLRFVARVTGELGVETARQIAHPDIALGFAGRAVEGEEPAVRRQTGVPQRALDAYRRHLTRGAVDPHELALRCGLAAPHIDDPSDAADCKQPVRRPRHRPHIVGNHDRFPLHPAHGRVKPLRLEIARPQEYQPTRRRVHGVGCQRQHRAELSRVERAQENPARALALRLEDLEPKTPPVRQE